MALDLTLRKDKGRVEQTVQMAAGSERSATIPLHRSGFVVDRLYIVYRQVF